MSHFLEPMDSIGSRCARVAMAVSLGGLVFYILGIMLLQLLEPRMRTGLMCFVRFRFSKDSRVYSP
jgi:hypothetical protein